MHAIRLIVLAACVSLSAGTASAQAIYPDKPVRILVGFTPGSATDISARIFAQKFSEAWSVPVTVENVPGAAGTVGIDRVVKATPDGYTLAFGANGALTIAGSLGKLSYDAATDLAPISLVLSMPSLVAVNNDVPVKTFPELVALAKAKPGQLSYATPGAGTPQHIAGELLKMLAGIDIVHVPYRGAVFTDVIGGRVTIALQNAGSMLAVVRDGKLRGLAVTSLKRSPNIPELPPIAELGFPGFEATSWFALLAPLGTPAPVIRKVQDEAAKVLREPDMRSRFAQLGLDPVGSSPAELGAVIKADTAKWARVIKEAGIKASE